MSLDRLQYLIERLQSLEDRTADQAMDTVELTAEYVRSEVLRIERELAGDNDEDRCSF